MSWFQKLLGSSEPMPRGGFAAVASRTLARKLEHTDTAVQCAFSFGWQAQTSRFGLTEHSARVALISRWLAEGLGLPEEDTRTLEHAAELHEIGMVAIPPALIRTPRPLTSEELARVRSHALIGAEIVRSAYEPLKGDLIENQYASLSTLRQRFGAEATTLRLAAILRVADVYDTLTHPRPYQSDLPEDRWREVLHAGMGSQFEPDAASLLLRGAV
jgi:HD-GYP domain-containing protein (c-di-GMP phosphodiesterase class II)